MNVSTTRTNICYGFHTRTSHKYIKKRKRKRKSLPLILKWFTITYHHHEKPIYKAKSFKDNQCIVAWGHTTSQVRGNVEPQKDHILFSFHIPFITLFISYPSIKPLISTTFIIHMGLFYHFPNYLFWVFLREFFIKY